MPLAASAARLRGGASAPQTMRRSLAAERTSCEVEGEAEVGVEDDAEQRAAAGAGRAAVGEGGVVGEHGADAGEEGVGGVAEAVDLGAGLGAGEPVGLAGGALGCGWGQFAVDRERGLEGNEGAAGLDEVGEGVVEVAGRLLEDADGDVDAGGAEFGDALAADERVGIDGGDDAAGDFGGDEGVGAGAGAAVMAAGLEGDVGGGAFARCGRARRPA